MSGIVNIFWWFYLFYIIDLHSQMVFLKYERWFID